jgi:oxygen-dependent protoporphyrinogen oxidase
VTARRVVVVGAGVAGLSAARAIRRLAPEVDVVVVEAQQRVGGLVETERSAGGFLMEHGADCLVTTKPRGLAAVRAVGLGDEIVVGTGARRSYVAGPSGLVPIPPVFGPLGPGAVWAFLMSPLLSPAGKARAALEVLVRARRETDDESVSDFAVRRFGHELAGAVLDPLIGGIYGADTSRLSVDACLPRLRDFEREHGSVTLGMQRALRARRRRVRAGAVVLPPVVTLRHGMGSLPAALARDLAVRFGVAVERITRAGSGFRLATTNGTLECEGVVLATPAWRIPGMIETLAPDLAADLASVAHKAIDCITFAWPRCDVPQRLAGTGWVRAAGDARATLACTWSSEKWPERAPSEFVLMRSVLALPTATEGDLVAAALGDLRDVLGIRASPAFVRVRRLPRATPIYAVGHSRLATRLAARAAELGAFALAGNAYQGVGIPDCVASGEEAAQMVLTTLGAAGDDTLPARGVGLGQGERATDGMIVSH